ncbi:type II/IV secretion system ATPase subunit [Methanococcoides burtonii]|nr:ATPase, T2SS/T4P/T4SS family [Methanococcoides burtonii]
MMVKKADEKTEEAGSDSVDDSGRKPAFKNDPDHLDNKGEELSGSDNLIAKGILPENRNETFASSSPKPEGPEVFEPKSGSTSSPVNRFGFEEPKIFKPVYGMDIDKEDLDAVILKPRGMSSPVNISKRPPEDREMENEFGILLPRSEKFGTNIPGRDPTEEWIPNVSDHERFKPITTVSEEELALQSVNSETHIPDVQDESLDVDTISDNVLEIKDNMPDEPSEDALSDDLTDGDAEEQFNEILTKQLVAGTDESTDEQPDEEPKDTDLKRVSAENIGFVQKIKNLFHNENEEIEAYDPELHGLLSCFDGIDNYEEVDRYWVNEPYVFIVILYNDDSNNHLYYAVEPSMSDFETVFLAEVQDRLRNILLVKKIGEDDDKEEVIGRVIRDIIKDYAIGITPDMLEKILYYTRRDFIHFGKIDSLMNDDSLEDISGNGHSKPIFLYHKTYLNIATNIIFDEEELDSFIIQLAQRSGKHISVADPMVDATMPDGSRIQMTLGTSVTTHGSTFTIRKFNEVPITPVDLLKWGTFSPEAMAYLWLCIENNKSLIYAGGTASGKTSSLNAVSLFIPEKAKIISLEDTRELKLPHLNWIPGVTRDSFTSDERGAVDMYDLLKAALRQRPEYLLVGEVRGKEALTLFQAMSTGHTTFSTMHADSVPSAIHRLENPPISVPRNMIQALDIMCIQAQTYSNGKRVRRNLKLVEIIDIDPNTHNIRTNDVFVWDSNTDTFHRTGESKALMDIRIQRGWNAMDVNNELKNRQLVLEYMVDNDIKDFKQISTIINTYQSNPNRILKHLNLL